MHVVSTSNRHVSKSLVVSKSSRISRLIIKVVLCEEASMLALYSLMWKPSSLMTSVPVADLYGGYQSFWSPRKKITGERPLCAFSLQLSFSTPSVQHLLWCFMVSCLFICLPH